MIKHIHSIRRFLLVSLLTLMVITTLAISFGNFLLDQRDIDAHLDNLLRQMAHSLSSVLGMGHFIERNVHELQNNIDQANGSLLKNLVEPAKQDDLVRFLPYYEFQVFNAKGKMILHSKHAPPIPFTTKPSGFSVEQKGNHEWRIYAVRDDRTGMRFIVAEKYDLRKLLERNIFLDDIYILLIMYPLASLLIWLIVGVGFKSLNQVTAEVSNRLPSYLEPVNDSNVPEEIKPLIIELNRLFFRLQRAFEREQRFAADAAHELKTPLAALKTQAQVALKSQSAEELIDTLRRVIIGVDRMNHVVQQLLILSRLTPDSEWARSQMTVFEPARIASEVIAYIVPSALEKNIEIELRASQHIRMRAHQAAISILLRNLIDNAVRYSPENTLVMVEITEQEGCIVFKVIDQGKGIPEELRDRVFERFYRILGNRSTGSGLGLAIVQQIAELHQAHIQLLTPSSGIGLEFQVWFPIIEHPF